MNIYKRLSELERGRAAHGIVIVYTHDGKTFATTSHGAAVLTLADAEAAAHGRRLVIVSYDAPSFNGAIGEQQNAN